MFSTFAKSEISKYGHNWENAKGNIILTNCALEKIRIPILVEHFLKPVQINSLIESSVIVWRRRSAFQILIQKGHMLVYVPYPKILKKIKVLRSQCLNIFPKSISWLWIIGSDCKLILAQMPEKAQKSWFVEKSNKFCKKKSENWIAVNIEFSLRYVGSESGKIARLNFRLSDSFNKLGFNRKNRQTKKWFLDLYLVVLNLLKLNSN